MLEMIPCFGFNRTLKQEKHIYVYLRNSDQYSQCTTTLYGSLRGVGEVGCHTRQSSFLPFMPLRGCKEYCVVTTPLSEERLVDWPLRSVSQERRGGGRATERQKAACR